MQVPEFTFRNFFAFYESETLHRSLNEIENLYFAGIQWSLCTTD